MQNSPVWYVSRIQISNLILSFQAYIPVSNKCRNLRQAISSSDLKQLEQGVVTGRGWDINSNYPLVSVICFLMCLWFANGAFVLKV